MFLISETPTGAGRWNLYQRKGGDFAFLGGFSTRADALAALAALNHAFAGA